MQETADVEYCGSNGDINEVRVALVEHYWQGVTSRLSLNYLVGWCIEGSTFSGVYRALFGAKKLQTIQVDLYGTTL